MRFLQQHLSGTKIVLDLGKRDCVPLFHPQIIKISAKLLALIKHRMFTFAASRENDLVCICDEAMERAVASPLSLFKGSDTHSAPQWLSVPTH